MALSFAEDAQSSHDQGRSVALRNQLVTGSTPPLPSAAAPLQSGGEASPAAWLNAPLAGSHRHHLVEPDPPAGQAESASLPLSQGLGTRSLLILAAIACIVLMLLVVPVARQDPYSRATLALSGSQQNGGRLFRINCAGCHGMAAQGLVGPNLHGVTHRKNNRQLIQQVVSGNTPPMPRFQPDPQAMADLLAFLHSLPD